MLHKGFYYKFLRHYIRLFGRENIHWFLFENMVNDFPSFRREVFHAVGAEDWSSILSPHVNASGLNEEMGLRDRQILREIFLQDIELTAELLGADLGYWLE